MLDYIGKIWKSTSDNPKAPFGSGEIEFMGRKIRITLWENHRKRVGKRDADFSVTLDKPREDNAPRQERRAVPHGENKPSSDGFADDIPF